MNNRLNLLIGIAMVLAVFVASDYLDSRTEQLRLQALQNRKTLSRYQALYEKRKNIKDISEALNKEFKLLKDRSLKASDPSEGLIILQKYIKHSLKGTSMNYGAFHLQMSGPRRG